MSQRLRFNTAREVFEAFPTAGDDMAAEPTDAAPVEFVRALVASPTPEDAITFTAYMLPRREAVWWGHQCLNYLPGTLGGEDQQFLALAESWVREPEEEQRNAALDAAMEAPTKTPGAWIALAAGWSGGSMLSEDQTPVGPPPFLTAKAVNAGILSALARIDRLDRAATLRTFVDMGLQLVERE
jgi:hypothetical protein